MRDILQEIVEYKRVEVARMMEEVPAEVLEGMVRGAAGTGSAASAGVPGGACGAAGVPDSAAVPGGTAGWLAAAKGAAGRRTHSMKSALEASGSGIIAEFKRRSPSDPAIAPGADAVTVARGYEKAGAAALSVLTDAHFFGGSLEDLVAVRAAVDLPILRKDFIICEYQLLQSRVAGADAVLLIAAVLSPEETYRLARKAHELGLEVLLETHSAQEIGHVNEFVDMVGVNNRNLGTFRTDVGNSLRLAGALPPDVLKVSESGISAPGTVVQLREAGFRGFLVGTAFMRSGEPGAALEAFVEGVRERV